MQLSIDMGNSRVKLGVFDGDELLRTEVYPSLTISLLQEVLYNHSIDLVILSSVRKPDADLEAYLDEHTRWVRLNADTPLPIRLLYKTPETLGQDRIAAAAGARALFPNQNCLVVDAGTCITYELLRADGAYLGGNIAPGLDMRLRAMHEFTARLPQVERGVLGSWIGEDTQTAIRNGAQWGAVLEVEGMLRQCADYFSAFQPVFTGGDADFLANHVKSKIFVHPHLVLVGLNSILRHYAN